MSGGGLTGLATGFNRADYAPDRLIARNQHLVHVDRIDLAPLTAALKRGALLGRTRGTTVPNAGTAHADNDGGGTVTGVSGGPEAIVGTYTLTAITAGAAARFNLIAPDGSLVDVVTTGVAYVGPHLNLTVNDGNPDFAVGDVFTVEVTVGGQFKLARPDATDGSHEPVAVLNRDAPVSAMAQQTTAIFRGDLDPNEITFGEGYTAADVRAALIQKGITLVTAVQAEERP